MQGIDVLLLHIIAETGLHPSSRMVRISVDLFLKSVHPIKGDVFLLRPEYLSSACTRRFETGQIVNFSEAAIPVGRASVIGIRHAQLNAT